ncbi:MAG TPA: tRNA epoxyqueuosine(34) reductase QueG [Bacteroidales bacterium]|nr:tRNA epoxyqueuosine(34) reductase QueG [Bacteroidales bacterium]
MIHHSLSKSELTAFIKEKAIELGFLDCGISKAEFLSSEEAELNKWLEEGRHGLMTYMERNKEMRLDPRKLVEGAKSVVTILQNYYPPVKLETNDNFKISKYAYGIDYHSLVKSKLHRLTEEIKHFFPDLIFRIFVDSAPVMDRVWAKKSGLGWIGKNGLVLNRKNGSYFFIGHIILDLELDYNTTEAKDLCATCTRCIDACPTNAIYEPRKVDARKCLSYQTIEFPIVSERSPKESYHDWIFGCDICQDVCPWNLKFLPTHQENDFLPKPELLAMRKADWHALSESQFDELFEKSALKRAKYAGLIKTIDWISG